MRLVPRWVWSGWLLKLGERWGRSLWGALFHNHLGRLKSGTKNCGLIMWCLYLFRREKENNDFYLKNIYLTHLDWYMSERIWGGRNTDMLNRLRAHELASLPQIVHSQTCMFYGCWWGRNDIPVLNENSNTCKSATVYYIWSTKAL